MRQTAGGWSRTPGLDGKGFPPEPTGASGGARSGLGDSPSGRRPRRYPTLEVPRARTRVAGGLAGSVGVHAFIVLLILWSGAHLSSELLGDGIGPGPVGGGGGGGGPQIVHIDLPPIASAASAPAAPRPRPRPQPAVEVPIPPPEPVAAPEVESVRPPQLRVEAALPAPLSAPVAPPAIAVGRAPGSGGGPGMGSGSGGGIGSGVGTGTGSNAGPGTGGGGRAYAPEPRTVAYPVDAPPTAIRGREYSLHFWVDERGRVTRVEVDPPIEDAAYRKKLLERVSQWIFYPARTADGQRVDGEIVVIYRP